ncbi:MAG TPA: DedA family protein [Bacteroidia bacterium]|nr:DedA family protein [Bacteroidia bacterium]HNT80845.1 DedA family protein [Bacteroidia bacterium]
MEFLNQLIDFILHLDVHLEAIMREYQTLTYFILCLIIFCETGLVATPFLPGDSLLFAAGAITAKTGILNVWILIPLLFSSAILGDNVNYFVGKFIGNKLFDMRGFKKILKREYLERTQTFYNKHGGQTIIIARFIPIIRTFAPFVAGVAKMPYPKYMFYCITGGILWVVSLTLLGYYFGNLEIVKNNFELVIFGIIFISLIPVAVQFFKMRSEIKKNNTNA